MYALWTKLLALQKNCMWYIRNDILAERVAKVAKTLIYCGKCRAKTKLNTNVIKLLKPARFGLAM